jgi:uncharacterized protein
MGAPSWLLRLTYSTDGQQVRVVWRFLAFSTVFLAATILMGIVRFLLTGKARPNFSSNVVSEPYFLLYRLTGIVAVVIATFVVLRTIEKKNWSNLGLHFSKQALRELAIGGLLVTIIMSIGFLALLAGGYAQVTGLALERGNLHLLLIQFLPVTFLVGLYEELLFRGYPFQVLCAGIGKWTATIAVALLFGLAHYPNPGATLMTASATALWSVLLCILLLRTKSLWCCIGFHFVGNLVQGFGFNSLVSGTQFTASLMHVQYSGADWITGKAGGLEAALPTLLAVCVSAAWVLKSSLWTSFPRTNLVFDDGHF